MNLFTVRFTVLILRMHQQYACTIFRIFADSSNIDINYNFLFIVDDASKKIDLQIGVHFTPKQKAITSP